jgi:hypothetical protein
MPPDWGGRLTEKDHAILAESWITPELADAAMLRRVDEQEGRQLVGQKGKRDCAGVLIPYYWPGDPHPFNYRIRRDNPDLVQATDGKIKQDRKYLGAPGAPNRLYVPPGITLEQLADGAVPIIIVEGEKKSLALWRLAHHESDRPRFIAVAIAGVWNWRGTVGKTGGPNGERLEVKGPVSDLSRIRWNGRTVFIIFDANVHTNGSVKAARKAIARELTKRGAKVKLVNLPEDCGVNGIDDLLAVWGPERVLELIDGAVDGDQLHIVPSPQFDALPSGMYRTTQQGEQLRRTQLTTYRASITTSVLLDDGIDVRREFEIDAELLGRHFNFIVPASDFLTMDWPITQMGQAAITFPNQREYARTAIQSFSMTATERRIYTHTGWRKVGRRWLFLHAGGAIGATGAIPGIEIRLAGALNRYELRLPDTADVTTAVTASLRLVRLGQASISFALLAATYRSVFGDADFALHLVGETGAFKSELAALHQRHFGSTMNRLHLPGAWSSTANAMEVLAFQAKDTLLVIDDFAPQGNAADVSRYHAAADRVFRAAGNSAERTRLDSSARLREPKPPRSLILSTGEDIPKGHSLRARLLVLELEKGSVLTRELTTCQADAERGPYAEAMGAFIRWLAARYEQIQEAFAARLLELRRSALCNAAHARTPEIVANLQAGFESYLDFAVECGALPFAERSGLAAECWEALRQSAAAQAKHHVVSEPTAMFLVLLRSVLASGRAHLGARNCGVPEAPASVGWRMNGSIWTPQGDCVGWVEGDDVYLEPAAAFRQVQLAGRDAGESLPVTEQTLKRRLRERELLASVDKRRQTVTVRRTIAGASKDVLHFRRATIFLEDPDDNSMDSHEQ